MVSKVDSHTKSFDLLQSAKILNSPVMKRQNFFTNHQRWQISRHLDCGIGSPIFHLRDSHGISHTVTEFIVENLDPEFKEALSQLTSMEEQQKLIHEYLQSRLDRATPYQVHAERHGNKLFLRFGNYGLKGGMKIWVIETGKTGALLFSVVQVGVGICLTVKGGNSAKLGGGALISAGLSSGLYAYQTDEKQKYEDTEYAKQFAYGATSGLITGAIGKFAASAGTVAKIGWQALASAVGGAAPTAVSEVVEYIGKDDKEKARKLKICSIKLCTN